MKIIKFQFFILLFWIHGNLFGQTLSPKEQQQIDSLRNTVLSSVLHDTTKANTCILLSDKWKKVNTDSSLYYADKSIQIIENRNINEPKSPNEDRILGEAYYRIGSQKEKLKDFNAAVFNYEKALSYFSKVNYKKGQSKVFTNFGSMNWRNGKYPLAKDYFDKAMLIDQELKDWEGLAIINLNYGHVNYYEGDFLKAEERYQISLEYFKQMKNQAGESNALNGLGEVYKKKNELSKAADYLSRSLDLRLKAGDKSGVAGSNINLGNVFVHQGNYVKAIEYYQKGIDGFAELGKKRELGSGYLGAGISYWYLGEIEKALEYYNKSLTISEENNDKRGIAKARTNMGLAYRTQGLYQKALENFRQSMILNSEIGNKEGLCADMNHMGLSLLNLELLDSALFYSSKAYTMSKANGLPELERASAQNLFRIYLTMNKLDSAGYYVERIRNELSKSLQNNYYSLAESDKEMYLLSMVPDLNAFYNFSLSHGKEINGFQIGAYNLALETKSLALKSVTLLKETILASNDTSLIGKYEEWIRIRKQLSKATGNESEVSLLRDQCNNLEAKLIAGSSFFAEMDHMKNISVSKVSSELKANEAAIELIQYDVIDYKKDKKISINYAALILLPGIPEPELILLCKESELKEILGRNFAGTNDYSNLVYGTLLNPAGSFYDLVWKKMEVALTGVNTIYYSPSGLLHKINFAALRDENGKYLGEKYALHQLNSTAEIVTRKKVDLKKEEPILVMGGIEYSNKNKERKVWNYLQGTKKESENIVSTMTKQGRTVKNYTGLLATEEAFKKEAPSCGIIHLSTHGFFFPDPEQIRKEKEQGWQKAGPEFASIRGAKIYADWSFVNNKNPLMRSGLVLAGANDVWDRETNEEGEDGVLTASEISNLNLSKAKLVVLSACETGLGDIKGSEGVYGLQRGLKMAGAKNLIMSLWKVPDAETEIFMSNFYQQLSEGKDIHTAFRNTQLTMMKKYDPYSWAAFVLVE